jgi:hypothetical protein
MRGGDAWDAAIRKQIKACTLFMPVISSNTTARAEGYFRLEWKLAVDRSHLMADERRFIMPAVDDRSPDMVYALAATRMSPQLLENAEYREILKRMNFPRPTT